MRDQFRAKSTKSASTSLQATTLFAIDNHHLVANDDDKETKAK
jgi:hypothetical protein